MSRLIGIALTLLIAGCASSRPYTAPPTMPGDQYPIPRPEYRDTFNDFTDFFDKQFTLQAEQFVDLSRHARKLSGNFKEAYNINAFDEVNNSSWFTNRNVYWNLTLDEIANGANTSKVDTANTWTIIRAKMEGVTAGFTIVDSRGDKYVIKFDPLGYAGLNSGSEVIGSRIFYAAGFNVPENNVCYFDPKILRIGDEVKLTDEKGRKRLMTDDDLTTILGTLQYEPNGLIRATASKYVEGKILGPFKYEDTRKDDLNDFIPHQHRRELRGLRVIGAWLNHIDAKGANSMDTYIGEDGEGYVRHYLIDFGTILGSGGKGPQPIYRGHENEFDPKALMLRLLSFGLYVPKWERVPEKVEYPCIGRYYAEYFDPIKFKPIFPNPAYDNLTARDGYWGAKIVMSFTDEQLRAVVEEARYPDPDAAEYLLNTLIKRRDLTGRYWFDRVTPLDNFKLATDNAGHYVLSFEDLAVETGLEPPGSTRYNFQLSKNGVVLTKADLSKSNNSIELLPEWIIGKIEGKSEYTQDQWEIKLRLKRNNEANSSRWVSIFIVKSASDGNLEIIGIDRQG